MFAMNWILDSTLFNLIHYMRISSATKPLSPNNCLPGEVEIVACARNGSDGVSVAEVIGICRSTCYRVSPVSTVKQAVWCCPWNKLMPSKLLDSSNSIWFQKFDWLFSFDYNAVVVWVKWIFSQSRTRRCHWSATCWALHLSRWMTSWSIRPSRTDSVMDVALTFWFSDLVLLIKHHCNLIV